MTDTPRPDDRTDDESNRNSPPSFLDLADWIEGRLTRSDAVDMEARVRAAGPATGETAAWIRGFLRFGRRNPMPNPPPILRQRLMQTFERHHGRFAAKTRRTATLSFDSRDDAVLSGVRGGFDIEEGYHLAFAAEELGVLLDVLPADGALRLDGQVLGADANAPVWEAIVEHPGGTIADIGGDTDGCFSIDGVPTDADRLLLSNGLVEIEIRRPLGESGA